MDDTAARRSQLARRTSALLREDSDFRDSMVVEMNDGTKPILVALLDDTVGSIFARIDADYPEGANIVVGDAVGRILVVVVRLELPRVGPFGHLPDDCPVHVNSQMGMLVSYLLVRGASISIMPVGQHDYAVELEPPVPA